MAKIDFTKIVLRDNDTDLTDLIPAEIDISKFIEAFKRHDLRIKKMVQQSQEFDIVTDEDNEAAVAMGSNAHAAIKELNNLEEQIVSPWKKAISAVRKVRSMYVTQLELVKKNFGAKVNLHAKKKRLQEEAEFKRQQKEQKKLEAKLKKDAKAAGLPAPDITMPEIKPPTLSPVKTEKGTSYQKKWWTYEVTDINKVPRKYMQLNKVQVNKDIRAHTSDGNCNLKIAGIRIYQKEDTVFKTR